MTELLTTHFAAYAVGRSTTTLHRKMREAGVRPAKVEKRVGGMQFYWKLSDVRKGLTKLRR